MGWKIELGATFDTEQEAKDALSTLENEVYRMNGEIIDTTEPQEA